MKRKVLLSIVFLLSAGFFSDDLLAQEPDTLDLSTDVFEYFRKPGPDGTRLRIAQSDSIRVKVNWQAEQNRLSSQKMQGFRVRIFFDNKQTARAESETIASSFMALYPQTAVYRIYENPYFKVTVGDFRTRSEAMRFMLEVRKTYPQAFITREAIAYPSL